MQPLSCSGSPFGLSGSEGVDRGFFEGQGEVQVGESPGSQGPGGSYVNRGSLVLSVKLLCWIIAECAGRR